ncbi:Kcnh7 [Symbiodinium necroappetens]|uniref:Kcnh7 protein n=1 Tax=Symbiodinium necroappetens TaxID=1628268 RepID=A0A812N1K0_9DINO|nr:Kcnh7 [Symbiodinium necroappetens]
MKLDIDDVSVALSDFQAPVVRAQLSTPSPAAQLHLQTMPHYFSVDIDISSLKVEVLNSVLRCWEPLLEPFAASVQVERRPDGEDGAGHAQQVVLTGKGPLLVNITPNMVKQTGFLLQLLSEAGSCQDQRGHRARVCWASGARYRAVNICEFPIELEVPGVQQTLTVPPTGSLWEPLDDWVLQSFATALRIRVPGGSFSRLLLLERADSLSLVMEMQVDGFISCLVDGAIEEHTALELSLEDAESVDFFEEDFLDVEWNEERSAVEEPVQLQVKTSAGRSSGITPKPNALLKYMCQLLDGALSGQARIFEQAAAPVDYLAAPNQPPRYACYAQIQPLCPKLSPTAPSASGVPGPPKTRFKHPQRAFLAQASTFPLKLQVPRPPSMPQAKRPPRRHFAVLTTNGDAGNAAVKAYKKCFGTGPRPFHLSQRNPEDKAAKRKEKLFSQAKAVLKVDPEAVKRRLDEVTNQQKLDVHHEVLKETQDEVEDHFEFITNLQALNQALRERDHKRERAQDSVMNMFATKCLSTVHAWLLSQFAFRLIERVLLSIDESLDSNQNGLYLLCYSIYAVFLAISVPPIQKWLSRVDNFDKYTRRHALVDLQVKALPMIMAWAFKDVVQYFLKYTDPDNSVVWNELAVTAGLVLVVAFLQHLPPVSRAGAELATATPNNSIINRYLTLPSTMFLGTGYAFNQLATYVVDVLSKLADDNNSDASTGQNAATIFKVLEKHKSRMACVGHADWCSWQVMFQVTYFGAMAFAVIRHLVCTISELLEVASVGQPAVRYIARKGIQSGSSRQTIPAPLS